jgi:dihydrofolate reductase
MRKLIASINVSLDSFMSGPNCELDWHFESWGPDLAQSFYEQLSSADTILLGRVTYCAMARYWPRKSLDLNFPREDIAFADMMNNHTKVVFTKTLAEPAWVNSKFIRGDLRKEIKKLKSQPGKDIIIYGSGKLINSMVELGGLIDEFTLWVHPVILGEGKPLFNSLQHRLRMKLVKSHTFRSGVVMLDYLDATAGN